MAVEAGRHTLFHPQMMLTNLTDIQHTSNNNNNNNNNTHIGYATCNPLTVYGYTDSMNGFPANNVALKAESGLTCSLPVSRKRTRDCSDLNSFPSFVNNNINSQNMNQNQLQRCGNGNGIGIGLGTGRYTFLGEDISMQIQQQQLEIDHFIAHQTDKVRLDIEERRKRNSRRIIAAVEENISNRLRAKEEEILKIAKLNWALEEKIKSLCVENQIWRELAQTNEATANTLRSNLKQVLEHVVNNDEYRTAACVDDAAVLADDAQSCCESNNEERRLLDQDIVNEECTSNININKCNGNNNNGNNGNRLCKTCGKEEASVLLLPCRHLCLCTICASSVNICPVCKSTKNISVHVNMS